MCTKFILYVAIRYGAWDACCLDTVPKNAPTPFYFWNNSVKNKPISIIFGAHTPEETW